MCPIRAFLQRKAFFDKHAPKLCIYLVPNKNIAHSLYGSAIYAQLRENSLTIFCANGDEVIMPPGFLVL